MWQEVGKKYGLWAGALVLSFAAGRYTMRQAVEKEVETRYEKRYTEMLSQVETRFSERLRESVESVKKEVQTASMKSNDIDEKIEVKPDGTHNITRKIRSRERTKTNTVVKKDKTTIEKQKDESTTKVEKQIVEVEKQVIKEVEKVIPPPSWRVYGVAAVSRPTDTRKVSYGAGGSYALGPVDVGGFGLYSPEGQDTTLGLTLGVSF
jgi:hypothetical protein